MAVETTLPMGILSRNEVRGDGREARRDNGSLCRQKALRGARAASPMSLARMQLPTGRNAGRVEPAAPDVAGSDPEILPWFGRGAAAYVHAPPRPFRGVAPV